MKENLKDLRDAFALKAMEMYFNKAAFSLIDLEGNASVKLPTEPHMAKLAYRIADEMIKARNA
mgnify:CR=1 FL=1